MNDRIGNGHGVSFALYKRIKDILLKCRAFRSFETLQSLFITEELFPFRNGLIKAETKEILVERNLEFFCDQTLDNGESLLQIVLPTLLVQAYPGTKLNEDITCLIRDLQNPSVVGEEIATDKMKGFDDTPIDELTKKIDLILNILKSHDNSMKEGITYILRKIHPDESKVMEKILDEVHQGRIEQSQLSQVVYSTQQAIRVILDSGVKIDDPQITNALNEIYQSVNSDLSFEQQFELTLPIIPFLLNYKIALSAGVDLRAVWEEWIKRFRK